MNAKIIAKALARCLENIARTIVSQKQTRFAPVRQLFLHISVLLNIIYSKVVVVISVDAEKVNLGWEMY